MTTTDNCPACGHEIGYHYEDGDGNVVCRFVSDCGCVEPHFGTIEKSAMHSGGSVGPERQGIDVLATDSQSAKGAEHE